MGTYHRQEMKRWLGRSDFGPVLASDVLDATATSVQAVAGHTVAGSFVVPRDALIKGVVINATGALDAGTVTYAVTYDGAVAATGSITTPRREGAEFCLLARQEAHIATSGTLVELCYAVTSNLASAQTLRLAAPVDYIGLQ